MEVQHITNHPQDVASLARVPAWAAANLDTLAGLYDANAGGRPAAAWAALAALPRFLNLENDVRDVARLAGGWNTANVQALARSYDADAGGRPLAEWLTIAAAAVNRERDVTAFARMPAWTGANATTLAGNFVLNAGGRSATDWATIAAAAVNVPAAVTTFAQMAAWSALHAAALVDAFQANPGGRAAAIWVTIAAGATDREDVVAAFSRLPVGWNTANIATLVGLFHANPGNQAVEDWVRLASVPQYLNQEVNVADAQTRQSLTRVRLGRLGLIGAAIPGVGGLPVGAARQREVFTQLGSWKGANALILANAFQANAGGRGAGIWVTIATVQRLINDYDSVIRFARVPAWTDVGVVGLAEHYGTDNGRLTQAQWLTIAGRAAFQNLPRDVAAFARLAGWTPADIDALSVLYQANAGGRTATAWTSLASLARFHNQPNDVRDFARLAGWTTANVIELARLYQADPGGRTAAQWVALATPARLRDHEEDVAAFARAAGWTVGNLQTLVGFYDGNAGGHTAAEWMAIARVPRFRDQENDVRDFARLGGRSGDEVRTLAELYDASAGAGGGGAAQWVAAIAPGGVAVPPTVPAFADPRVNPGGVVGVAGFGGWSVAESGNVTALRTALNPGNHSLADWQAIGAYGRFRDRSADVAAFARLPGWTIDQILLLAGLYNSAPGVLSAAQWVAIATRGSFTNHPLDVASLARVAAWAAGNLDTLAGLYDANAGGRPATAWAAMAALPRFLNLENDVRDVARLAGGWNTANVQALARSYDADAGGRPLAEWLTIAAAVANVNHERDVAAYARLAPSLTSAHIVATVAVLRPTLNLEQFLALMGHLHPTLTSAQINAFATAPIGGARITPFYNIATTTNFAQTMATLLGGGWNNANIETVLTDYVALGPRSPLPTVFTEIILFAQRRGYPVADVRDCLQGGVITREQWGEVVPHAQRFVTAGHAQPAGPFGMGGGTILVGGTTNYPAAAPPYQVRVIVRQQRANHFNAGHTFAHFLFDPANVHRAPYSSMFSEAILQAEGVISPGAGGLGPIPEFAPPAPVEADNAAWGGAGPTQRIRPDYTVSFSLSGGPFGGANRYDVQISQFFPTLWSAHEVHEEVLEAIGQLFGHL